MDEVKALLTAATLQMGGSSMHDKKEIGKDGHDFTYDIKVEVPHSKKDHHVNRCKHM